MKDRIVGWSRKKYGRKQKLLALFLSGIMVLILIPLAIAGIASLLDSWLGLAPVIPQPLGIIIATILAVLGLLFAGWSVWVQYKIGNGTPVPALPTQKLIVSGPYIYCRNPMILGTAVFYMGFGCWINSLSAIGLAVLFMLLLIVYVKFIEEKELETRFGQEYAAYKENTPFLIPRIKSG